MTNSNVRICQQCPYLVAAQKEYHKLCMAVNRKFGGIAGWTCGVNGYNEEDSKQYWNRIGLDIETGIPLEDEATKEVPTIAPKMQIIRGLPGSGKTTLAVKRYSHLLRIETDMFFQRESKYIYTEDLNKKAVEWFYHMVESACKGKIDFVVTGVFAAHTERLERVVSTALRNGYEVYLHTQTAQYKGTHNVPQGTFESMKRHFISEQELKSIYSKVDFPNIEFGLMN